MKTINFTVLLLFNIHSLFAQYNIVYPSNHSYRIAEGIFTDIIGEPNGDAYFGSVAWSLDPIDYYGFTEVTKVNKSGKLIWSKGVTDSIPWKSTHPHAMHRLRNGNFIINGGIYSDSGWVKSEWYGVFDKEFNLLSSHAYPHDYYYNDVVQFLEHSSGDLVFCGIRGIKSDRRNVGLSKAKASVFCTDSLGNLKWDYEFWDTTLTNHFSYFNYLTEDHFGNIYVCGQNNNYNTIDMNGIIAKFDRQGNKLWYKEYNNPDIQERYMYCKEMQDGNILLLGSSFTRSNRGSILVNHISPDGDLLVHKTHTNRYATFYWRCKETSDGGIVCGGAEDDDKDDRHNGWIQKLDETGEPLWEHSINASKSEKAFYNLGLAEDGGFYFGGISFLPGINESRNWLVRTDSNGCVVPGCNPVGVTEKEYHKESFLISPNPAQDYIHVYINDADHYEEEYEMTLYDSYSRIVTTQAISGRVTQIDIATLPSGIYYYRISKKNKLMQTGKLIKVVSN
ncbi:MAG TPA: T9SS type A sorting domain-containing protein [Saprospiraceae bacterium]|nr:T9SS type A sorting domain-containing protein [Saprospiraceae bacterium]